MVQNISWEWLVQGFKIELETQLKPKTVKDYCNHVSYFARWAQANQKDKPRFILKRDIQEFLHYVATKDKPFASPQKQGNRPKSRGEQVENVTTHSVRLPGLQAHQEVIFGTPGQTLTIRHDIFSPECYMPGVIFAIKEAVKRREFIYGLDTLLNL